MVLIKYDSTDIENPQLNLELLLEQSKHYMSKAKADNTVISYKSDWAHFKSWCIKYEQPYLPTTDEAYGSYLTSLAASGYKVSTIQRRISSISRAHIMKKLESPNTIHIKTIWSGIKRIHGSAEVGKNPITVNTLKEILQHVPENRMIGYRDRALLLIGFSGAYRRSELVNFDVKDIRTTPEGMIMRIAKSKTDQEGKGEFIGIPYGSRLETCPVRSYNEWIKQSGITDGAIFRPVNKHSHVSEKRLSDKAVALIIKKYVAAVGLDPALYAGHSIRSGFATSAAMLGKSERSIKEQTRHASDAMVRRYIRMGSLFTENAAQNIGL
ncbi:site-specific integrase [Paenibacillus sp. AGC30]